MLEHLSRWADDHNIRLRILKITIVLRRIKIAFGIHCSAIHAKAIRAGEENAAVGDIACVIQIVNENATAGKPKFLPRGAIWIHRQPT